MTDKQSEIITHLHQRSWESFDERRRHDYRISILVWGIFIASIALVLNLEKDLSRSVKFGFTLGLAALAIIYVGWNFGLARLNRLDRRMAVFYGDKLRKRCDIYDEFYQLFDPVHTCGIIRPEMGNMTLWEYLKNWNHRACLSVTILLTLGAIGVVWFPPETPKAGQADKKTVPPAAAPSVNPPQGTNALTIR